MGPLTMTLEEVRSIVIGVEQGIPYLYGGRLVLK